MKQNKGITLVALVVTIIIILILAGISINTLAGDNGIITKAQQAKENMILAQGEEEKQLNELYSQLNSIGNGSIDTGDSQAIEKLLNFKKVISTVITNEGVATQETDSAEVMASHIGKILQERTKDATATEEDIAEGKTAWVNGQKIMGTKEKNYNIVKINPVSNYTYNVSNYISYKDFTTENFIIEVNGYQTRGYSVGSTNGNRTIKNYTVSKLYDSEKGILVINNIYGETGVSDKWWLGMDLSITVYLIY